MNGQLNGDVDFMEGMRAHMFPFILELANSPMSLFLPDHRFCPSVTSGPFVIPE